MISKPTFVRALTNGLWRAVDVLDHAGRKVAEKQLIRPLVHMAPWCLDHKPIVTQEGVCVSVLNEADAEYFLAPKVVQTADGYVERLIAERVTVQPNVIVMFADPADAQFFVNQGLGDRMSEAEIEAMMNRVAQQAEREDAEAAAQQQVDGAAIEAEAVVDIRDAGRKPGKRGRPRKAA